MKKTLSILALLAVFTSMATAFEPIDLQTDASVEFGGDVRIRQVYFDNIPIVADPPGVTRGGRNHFFRFRSRFWGQADFGERATLYTRFAHEFRHYEKGTDTSWDWEDELIVDNLYLDINGLLGGRLDARIGRQDLIYGTGKLLLEGTPKDGSRTLYFDAVRLRFNADTKNTLDVLGIYNQPENQLAISSQNRDLTGFDPAFNDLTESGGGLYLMNTQMDAMPFEAYYLYKRESSWVNRQGDRQPGRNVHTIGTRLMPRRQCGTSANLEIAHQFGETSDDRTLQAWMIDAVVRRSIEKLPTQPVIGVGVYHITGNDPETNRDEGWNPLWARFPQYSELYVYAFDAEAAGRWSNVTLPYLSIRCSPTGNSQLALLGGYMLAPERNGPGGGKERGWLGTARYDFTIARQLLTNKDRLFGHLLFEVFEPGNYYNVSDTAFFTRWELSYAF